MRLSAPGLGIPERSAWPRIARLWAFALGALVVWSRLGVFLHEAAGHALVWRAGGGDVTGIEVSLFGGGVTWIDLEAGGRCPAFLFRLAGVFVNLALGLALGVALVWLLARGRAGAESRGDRRASASFLLEHVLAWGAVLNLAGATHYTVLGAFYEFGDPAPFRWLWGPSMLALLLATPVTFHLWARTLVPLLRGATSPEGAGASSRSKVPLGFTGLVVAAVPLVAYCVGLAVESHVKDTNFRALQAESAAVARAVEAERARRLDEWRAEHGDEEPPPEVTEVTEEDVERPFPLTAVVLGLDAVFLGIVLFRRGPRAGAPVDAHPGVTPRVPWLSPLALAAATRLVLAALF